jgi:hypothetical protein
MRTRHLLFSLAGLGLGLVVTGACTNDAGGVGTGIPTQGSGQEPTGGSGYESPGSGYEPTGGQEPAGSGTDPSGAAGCLPCTTYACSVSYTGSNGSTPAVLQLTTLPGGAGCTTGSGGSELLCDGTVDAPQGDGGAVGVVGSWTRAGAGFVASGSVSIPGVGSGVLVSVACQPGGASSSAGNSGGSSASSSSGGTPITFDAGGVVITFDAG